jgi:phenylpropionate dioxygenase-like ring-hydroxylating dioxygenase large terminal subunit
VRAYETVPGPLTRDDLVGDLRHAIEEGMTLPPHWYTAPEVLELEQEHVFDRGWHYAAHASRLQEPGDVVPTTIGKVPVLVLMDKDRAIRAFLNICRHRGHEVVPACAERPARRGTLQCPYHGWTFDLDGALRAAPRSKREPNFDKDALGLIPVAVGQWGPLVFVSLEAEPIPFAEYLGPMPAIAAERGLDFEGFVEHQQITYDFATNWKIAVDNNFECYHCAVAHPEFAKLFSVAPDHYEIQTYEWTATQLSPNKHVPGSTVESWGDFRFYYVWPGTFVIDHSITYNVISISPTAPGRTAMKFDVFRREDGDQQAIDEYAGFYDTVFRQDAALIESVQRGQESGRFPPGPLLLDSEHLLRYLQARLLHALDG